MVTFTAHAKFSRPGVRRIGRDIEQRRIEALANRTDFAIEHIIKRAEYLLRDDGFVAEADQIRSEYEAGYRGYLTKNFSNRHIGDHKPAIVWLAKTYQTLLHSVCFDNTDICQALHLSDLATLSWGIGVVFHPATFEMDGVPGKRIDEYRRHFSADDGLGPYGKLYGVASVCTYWAVDIGCAVATSGLGFVSMICGLAGSGAEWFSAKAVMPPVSDMVFNEFCGNNCD